MDRLARSTRDLLNTLDAVTKAGAAFRSLADTWADTTTPHGRLILTVLGGLAEFERELIRARTGEGRERAKARGVHMGRPPKLTLHQRAEALRRREAGETTRELARLFNKNIYLVICGKRTAVVRRRDDATHELWSRPLYEEGDWEKDDKKGSE